MYGYFRQKSSDNALFSAKNFIDNQVARDFSSGNQILAGGSRQSSPTKRIYHNPGSGKRRRETNTVIFNKMSAGWRGKNPGGLAGGTFSPFRHVHSSRQSTLSPSQDLRASSNLFNYICTSKVTPTPTPIRYYSQIFIQLPLH